MFNDIKFNYCDCIFDLAQDEKTNDITKTNLGSCSSHTFHRLSR